MKRNRTALITGSARGLGVRIAHELASHGIRIAINYRTSVVEAEHLKHELETAYGSETLLLSGDVSHPADAERMALAVIDAWGSLDMLILNAGPYIKERKKLADYTPSEWDAMVNGNLSSAFYLCRAAIPYMRRQRFGRIVTVGFEKAQTAPGWMYRSAFAAAKTGLVSLTRTIALEEAEAGITANMVCPGDIIGDDKQRRISEARQIDQGDTPVGRAGTGEDIARAISFFCAEASDFITGTVLEVTGGKDVLNKYKLEGER
ncbi:3-oxoacyl-[acyl-carrier protein] reductase [Aneurinibacillus soli]|uniref:3-oxoacyl-[acyl-carrier-protein] reductase FabG n=1 Tax=Aneurinibacillus soli TaxID=1500254 RepID=A0A0U5ASQ1_9BACL|nr:SDR family oxidoreductase [Aneurinibacillus soli]PYE60945.1 3-oxoacyl-[acyl-carrier protein] reductase [Aneurinibacillus soli]BAU26849.1 3-oxoacyl-[acyl-carrier-protein] reductase FabG [Aneurinibacillus soli]